MLISELRPAASTFGPWTWNDSFGPLTYLTGSSVFTVPIAMNALVDSESDQGTGTPHGDVIDLPSPL